MGHLHRLPIADWRVRYGLRSFVETGTWRGDGIAAALIAGYAPCYSIEANADLAQRAAARLHQQFPGREGDWQILWGDSAEMVGLLVAKIDFESRGPTLWWLDAHLPENYGIAGRAARLPLLAELEAICGRPGRGTDAIAIDDWRLYEALAYRNGPFPGGPPPGAAEAPRIRSLLALAGLMETVSRADEGYLLALPR